MKIPFFTYKDKNPEKESLQKAIKNESVKIIKLVLTRKLKNNDIDKLEHLYKEYFKKFPDIKKEMESHDKIKKMRIIVN